MNAALLARRDRLPTAGLVALYDFVQGPDPQMLYDRSGNGLHGVLGATPGVDAADPTWTPQGLMFDGTDDLVTLPNLPGSGGAGTFIFTVPNPATAGVATIYSQSSQSSTVGFYWIYRAAGSGTSITFQYATGAAPAQTAGVAPWATGDLCGIVADYTAGLIKFFRNGEFLSAWPMETPRLPPTAVSRLGRYFSGTQGASGPLSLFVRYDRTFSDAEMMQALRRARRTLARRSVILP